MSDQRRAALDLVAIAICVNQNLGAFLPENNYLSPERNSGLNFVQFCMTPGLRAGAPVNGHREPAVSGRRK